MTDIRSYTIGEEEYNKENKQKINRDDKIIKYTNKKTNISQIDQKSNSTVNKQQNIYV